MAEAGSVFETVAEHSVHADVREPAERQASDGFTVSRQPSAKEKDGWRFGVDNVVEDRSGSGVGEISCHAQIRDEQEASKSPPRLPGAPVGPDGGAENTGALQPQERSWPGLHEPVFHLVIFAEAETRLELTVFWERKESRSGTRRWRPRGWRGSQELLVENEECE